jgi:two-component system, probable response regulator PhcQ
MNGTASTTKTARPTVLFVDDERSVIEGLRDALRKEPYRVLVATSGEEALELLARNDVAVVVSDEQMPNMPGSVFLSIVRQRYPSTMRMILTGQASLDAAVRAINEGEIYRFLAKPCAPLDLAQSIRHALQTRELTEQSARLLITARMQRGVIAELERGHPGITAVARGVDGSVIIDDELTADLDIANLIRGITAELDERVVTTSGMDARPHRRAS